MNKTLIFTATYNESKNIEKFIEKVFKASNEVDLLIIEREGFYHKFLSTKIGKTAETVDKALAIKMQREIKSLLKDKEALIDENDRLVEENKARVDQVKQVLQK